MSFAVSECVMVLSCLKADDVRGGVCDAGRFIVVAGVVNTVEEGTEQQDGLNNAFVKQQQKV